MKKTVITILCLLVFQELFAQTEQFELPKLIPPSPNAFELSKHGQIPIGLFTGAINYSIPLFTYQTKNLAVPISLSYISNGIKVDQISSKVGLGWTLNTGGVISRIVRDQDDQELSGYFPEEDMLGPIADNPVACQYFYDATSEFVDTEPDQFMFNFNGYSGQFVYDNDRKIVLLPHQDLKVESVCDDIGCGFSITTPDGIKYIFNDSEITNATLQGSGHPMPNFVVTAWYITKVIHPNGDEINFIYSGEYYNYISGISESIDIIPDGGGCETSYQPPSNSFNNRNTVFHKSQVTGKKLVEISSNKPEYGKLIFTYETNNSEITGYDYVKDITFREDLVATPVQKFSFEYQTTANNRIFLKNVTLIDPSQKYEFDYVDAHDFPQRLSKSQDHWGYFNHKNNQILIPKPDNSPSYHGFSDAADRSPDHTYTEKGLLKRITYPTKGYNEIYYEANTYHGELLITPPTVQLYLETSVPSTYPDPSYTVTEPLFSPCVQTININVYVGYNTNGEDCNETINDHTKSTLLITNNLTGENIPFYTLNAVGNQTAISGGNFIPPSTECYANLEANTSYTVKLKPNYECVETSAQIWYLNASPYTIETEIPTGGMRVNKVIEFDLLNPKGSTTRYYYGSMLEKDISSGDPGNIPIYKSITKTMEACAVPCSYEITTHHILNSNSLNPLYNSSENSTFYKYVTISYGGEDFENGGEEHEFIINRDVPGNLLTGSNYIYNAPWTNSGWDIGKEKQITQFKKKDNGSELIKVNQTLNQYVVDSRNFNEVYGYSIRKNYGDLPCSNDLVHTCTSEETQRHSFYWACENYLPTHKHAYNILHICIAPGAVIDHREWQHPCFEKPIGYQYVNMKNIENLDVIAYKNISFWSYLDKSYTYRFDANGQQLSNPIETSYSYENENHIQQTKVVTKDSKDQTITQKTYYPDDVNSQTSLPGGSIKNEEFLAIEKLKKNDQHRIGIPIQIDQSVNGNTINTTRYLYKQDGNLVLPSIIQTATNANSLENRIVYIDYDESNGNILQAQKENDIPLRYIYGYNNTKLIAETQNATITETQNSTTTECDYTGFENHEAPGWQTGTWTYTDQLNQVKTGKSAIQVNGYGPGKYFEQGPLSAKKHSGFKASVWVFGGTDAYIHIQINNDLTLSNRTYNPNIINPNTLKQDWNLIEVDLPYIMYKDITTNFNIKVYCGSGGEAYFDDLRFHPMDAQMTTYTYAPLIGVTSVSDINNKPTYYKYDGFNRLWYVQDFLGNILKKYEYHYK